MKSINKIIIAVATLAMTTAMTSCDYLEIEPENSVPEESVDFTKTEDMYQPVSGVYAANPHQGYALDYQPDVGGT